MKRFLGILLTVMLLCGQILTPAALATADEGEVEFGEGSGQEIASEVKTSTSNVQDATVTESLDNDYAIEMLSYEEEGDDEVVKASGDTGAQGLVVDEGVNSVDDVAAPTEEQKEPEAASDSQETGIVETLETPTTSYDYGRIAEGGAEVFAGADADAASAKLAGGAVVLLTGMSEGQRVQVAFDTDDGAAKAWVNADSIGTLTAEEKKDYLDKAPEGARYYEEDTNALMAKVTLEKIEAPETPAAETEATAAPDTTETTDATQTENTNTTETTNTTENENTDTTKTTDTQGNENTDNTETTNTEGTGNTDNTETTNTEGTENTDNTETTGQTTQENNESTQENSEETQENNEETQENNEETQENNEENAEGEGQDEQEQKEGSSADEVNLSEANETAAETIVPSFTEAQMLLGASRTIEVKDIAGNRLSAPQLTFESSDANIASVNAAGTVYARRAGAVVITASYDPSAADATANAASEEDASEGSAAAAARVMTCEVKIQVLGMPGWIGASPAARTIAVGETYTGLRAAFPAGTGANVTFTSSKPKIATVNKYTGAIYGKKKGKTVITITTSNGKKAKCKITVMKAATKISLSAGSLMIARDGRTAQLGTAVPKKTTGGVLLWTTSNPEVATVNGNGLVTSGVPGTAVITVRTLNGVGGKSRAASCRVTVTEPPAEARYSSTSASVWLGGTVVPGITALDKDGKPAAIHGSFRIVSASPAGCVALNTSNGAVRGVRTGTAVITFKTYNGIESENSVTVHVYAKVKKIKISGTKSMTAGQQYAGWKITLKPAGAYNVLTFSSSKPSVLRVVNARTGQVQALKKGTATITVKAHNGKKAKIKVKVKKAPAAPKAPTVVLPFSSLQVVQSTPISAAHKTLVDNIISLARSRLNINGKPAPYVSGANGPYKFDCSGFVYYCYLQVAKIKLGDTAYKQGYYGSYAVVREIQYLQPGDIVCFNTSSDADLSDHTGIYLGSNQFIHASSSGGCVMISNFYDKSKGNYYLNHFSWGRRVFVN